MPVNPYVVTIIETKERQYFRDQLETIQYYEPMLSIVQDILCDCNMRQLRRVQEGIYNFDIKIPFPDTQLELEKYTTNR